MEGGNIISSLRSGAARCSYAGMDEEGEDVPDEECYKESSSRRRRKDDDDAPFEGWFPPFLFQFILIQ